MVIVIRNVSQKLGSIKVEKYVESGVSLRNVELPQRVSSQLRGPSGGISIICINYLEIEEFKGKSSTPRPVSTLLNRTV